MSFKKIADTSFKNENIKMKAIPVNFLKVARFFCHELHY